ncbi:MAG: ABC transporter ATP-binding protein [Neisseria sp.]|jgi:ABC-2 type transport system ATP-binding protein|uniref:ABC transporter ATP-binding protein n=1 Tax=Uruburuella suis TaxID=252130 RepID=UPI001B64A02B|nr:ABC transporter ATP-binding protein [Neisseria sp.]
MIRIENLCHRYPAAAAAALDNVCLTVAQGEALGLLGPNGAGKTTLMSLLAGLQPVQQGQIVFNNQPLAELSRAQKQRISLVPQDFAFYPLLSVWENLCFFAALYGVKDKQHLRNLIEQTDLGAHTAKLAKNLSGGLKRRLNFAIGLINRPTLIFLDEITVGIDPESRRFILKSVAALTAEGITVIYTSHYLQEIETLCSQIALLNHGRLVYHGALGDILQQGGQHILRFQTVPPCSPAQAAAWGGSLDEQGAVQLATDEAGAAHIWQMVRQQGFQTAFFQFGHGSLEAFYLDFLNRQVAP